MIPFIKILDHYICDNQIDKSFIINNDSCYLLNCFDDKIINDNVFYSQCLIQSNNIFKYLPEYTDSKPLTDSRNRFKAHLNALKHTKITKDVLSFIPDKVVIDYGNHLSRYIQFISEYQTIPKDYIYLEYAFLISEYISKNHLIFKDEKIIINYDPFTSYGRFKLKNDSFGILFLNKNLRRYLKPESDEFIFYEFDYNAFEIRTLFALLNVKQPSGDLYNILHEKSKDIDTRDMFKNKLIANLYSCNEDKTILNNLLISNDFYKKYPIKNGKVENIFGKKMETDSYHLMSRVLQSSAAYILFQQVYSLIRYIQTFNKKSKVSFCIHDSVCLSVHKNEIDEISIYQNILENINISELNYESIFPMKVKSGKTYGDLC